MMNEELPTLDPDDIITVEETPERKIEKEKFYRDFILMPRILFWLGILLLVFLLLVR